MKFNGYCFTCNCEKFVILPDEIYFKTTKYSVWIVNECSYISKNKVSSPMITINSKIIFNLNKNLDSQIENYLLLS